jgi:hypothetical protein
MEVISTYYFDLYPIEQEDVVENFKTRMSEITTKLELKYEIFVDNDNENGETNIGTPMMMGGGFESTFPYNMFETILNYVNDAKSKVSESSQINTKFEEVKPNTTSEQTTGETESDTVTAVEIKSTGVEYPNSDNLDKDKTLEKNERIYTEKLFKPSPEPISKPMEPNSQSIEEEEDYDFDLESDDDEEVKKMEKEIITMRMNVYDVKEKREELILKCKKMR